MLGMHGSHVLKIQAERHRLCRNSTNSAYFSGTILQTAGQFSAFRPLYHPSANFDVRNNIFTINTSSPYRAKFYTCFSEMDQVAGSSVSDYNILSCTAGAMAQGYIGQYAFTDISSLADWKTSTGFDIHSRDAAVHFVSDTDLHLTGLSVGDTVHLAGVPIAGYITDIDNEARSSGTPYIGADENKAVALPVKLLSLSGIAENEDVLLSWLCAFEVNNKGFVIEHSFNNLNFTAINFVAGRGNAATAARYTYTDKNAFSAASTIYYRLKQLDHNDYYSYSKTIPVTNTQQSSLTHVYPNPFTHQLFIQIASEGITPAKVILMDITGRVLVTRSFETVKGINTFNISDEAVPNPGVYFLSVEVEGKLQVHKIMKAE